MTQSQSQTRNPNQIGVIKGTKRGPYKRSQQKKSVDNLDVEDGMSYEEIAIVLGITVGEVKTIEHQAMQKLRRPSALNKSLHHYDDIKLSDSDKNLSL